MTETTTVDQPTEPIDPAELPDAPTPDSDNGEGEDPDTMGPDKGE